MPQAAIPYSGRVSPSKTLGGGVNALLRATSSSSLLGGDRSEGKLHTGHLSTVSLGSNPRSSRASAPCTYGHKIEVLHRLSLRLWLGLLRVLQNLQVCSARLPCHIALRPNLRGTRTQRDLASFWLRVFEATAMKRSLPRQKLTGLAPHTPAGSTPPSFTGRDERNCEASERARTVS